MSLRVILFLILCLLLQGCSTFKKKGTWGKNTFSFVKSERIQKAFIKNITSSHVIVPVAGAALVHVMAYDNKISKWVHKDKTIYNEQHEAENYSDNFNLALKYEMYLSILLPPSNDNEGSAGNYLMNKVKGGLLVNMASSSSKIAQHAIRGQTKRRRPNNLDYNSLPSGHATEAGSRNVLIARNLEASDIDPFLKNGINGVNTAMSIGVLWARIECRRHYPSDVLLGYALGHFLSGFIYDSLINYDENVSVSAAPTPTGYFGGITFNF